MKVLMFGWEFPPHISGGLGTACFGLTQSLLKQKVKVLFVVPKTSEEQSRTHKYLISASKVLNGSRNGKRYHTTYQKRPINTIQTNASKDIVSAPVFIAYEKAFQYFEVSADLNPYRRPVSAGAETHRVPLTTWNHTLREETETVTDIKTIHEWWQTQTSSAIVDTAEETTVFSGTYNGNLLQEVERYAEVAGIIARKHAFDVIHAHDWMTFPAGVTAKRKSRKPLIIHVHSTEFDRSGENVNDMILQIEQEGMAEADKVITVSNWTKQIVMSRYNVPEKKVTVVHNGILPKEPQAKFSFPDIASHFVTFLGRVTHQKGPGFFVEAAQIVLQEFPHAHFIVAGAGDLLPQIIERVAQLNMSANFHFTGFLTNSQVEQIWSLTDVYAMPSVSEPFGIAPLEAIQGDVPVILSNQSGVSEVMPHAIKVDFWDVKALAAAICSVLKYESLSHVLRQNSKKHIKQLTWEKAARDVKALYHECSKK
jgi:glycogen synthase